MFPGNSLASACDITTVMGCRMIAGITGNGIGKMASVFSQSLMHKTCIWCKLRLLSRSVCLFTETKTFIITVSCKHGEATWPV